TVANNQATGGSGGTGGSIYSGRDCPAVGNSTGGDAIGGAIDNAGRLSASNCTIWVNTSVGGSSSNKCTTTVTAPGGSFAASINTHTGARTVLLNTIVGNLASTSNCVGVITDLGHNIASDASGNFT